MFNWVDFLVVLATVLVFGAVAATANSHHAKAQSSSSSSSDVITNLPQQASQDSNELGVGLIKARIRLAQGAPWS
jgi:hypothetical protein